MFKKYLNKEFIWPFLILLLAAVLRLLWLDRVPGAITGDELNYVLPIRSVALSGFDFSGNWNIFQALIFSYPTALPQAELSYFLLYPAIALLPLSLFTTKITYALFSVGTVFAVYLLTDKLLGRRAAIAAGFIAAINPWEIFMGRTVYEVVIADFFYVLAIYFLIKEKGNRILLSLPIFLLAFYSYIGTKIILVPIVIAVSFYSYLLNKGKFAKQYLILNVACILMVLFFAFSISQGSNRTGEIATPFAPVISQQVDALRKQSIAAPKVASIFENKYTMYLRLLATKEFEVFSPHLLFISGDNFTSFYQHGLFYIVDAIFLVLGIGFMMAKKGRIATLVGALILIATVPQVLHTTKLEVFTPHITLFFVFLMIPIGFGISETMGLFKKKWAVIVIVGIYVLSFANFFYIYFFQFPKVAHFDFASRVLSKYVSEASKDGKKIDVYVKTDDDFYKKYIYYSNSLNRENYEEIKKSVNTKNYKLGNVRILACTEFEDAKAGVTAVFQTSLCAEAATGSANLRIARLDDAGDIYRIIDDSTCSKYDLKSYPYGLKIGDFSVENLSTQKFCETFVTK